ncbi:hypothetical protein ABG067_001553 [Albugo candida]|uniref:Uncharacterized protein n=1 Tax=Albugo candida TaxID=65357 RepID=A0A024GPX7_9STRA|nr:unnamed protein product [Albugo candida]|eukprot:CCI48399.1 unnamed protein product [Albugo candida]
MGSVAGCCRRYCGCHRELNKKEIDHQAAWFDHDCTPLVYARYDEDDKSMYTNESRVTPVVFKRSSPHFDKQNETRAFVSASTNTKHHSKPNNDSESASSPRAKATSAARKDKSSTESRPSPKSSSPRRIHRYGRKHYRAENR